MITLGLATATKVRMRLLFRDKRCKDCGGEAARFVLSGRGEEKGKRRPVYYCHDCYQGEPTPLVFRPIPERALAG